MPAALYDHRKLNDQADEFWRQVIYGKSPDGACARCGKIRPLEAAHNVGRRSGGSIATRHDPDNGLPLCSWCHRLIDSDGEGKRALFLAHLGPERYERLQLMKHGEGKVDLKLVIVNLEALLRGREEAK